MGGCICCSEREDYSPGTARICEECRQIISISDSVIFEELGFCQNCKFAWIKRLQGPYTQFGQIEAAINQRIFDRKQT